MGARSAPAEAPGRSAEAVGHLGRHGPYLEAVVWGADADQRLLLRGLLKMQHHAVVFEARSPEDLDDLPDTLERRLLLVDAESADPAWDGALSAVVRRHPSLLPVVVLPHGASRADEARARACGARATLVRPFTVQELERAIGLATVDTVPPTSRSAP